MRIEKFAKAGRLRQLATGRVRPTGGHASRVCSQNMLLLFPVFLLAVVLRGGGSVAVAVTAGVRAFAFPITG
jgi:hypothetical protein